MRLVLMLTHWWVAVHFWGVVQSASTLEPLSMLGPHTNTDDATVGHCQAQDGSVGVQVSIVYCCFTSLFSCTLFSYGLFGEPCLCAELGHFDLRSLT